MGTPSKRSFCAATITRWSRPSRHQGVICSWRAPLGGLGRQPDDEGAAATDTLTDCLHVPTVQLRDFADQGETHTQTSHGLPLVFIRSYEQVEDMGKALVRDAGAIVLDHEHDESFARLQTDPDLAIRRRVLAGIVEQIRDDLAQSRAVEKRA